MTDGRLLDVGTGPGTVAAAAAARGYRRERGGCRGLDGPDREAAASRSSRSPRRPCPTLPFGDEAFDVVTASFVINHVAGSGGGDRRARTGDGIRRGGRRHGLAGRRQPAASAVGGGPRAGGRRRLPGRHAERGGRDRSLGRRASTGLLTAGGTGRRRRLVPGVDVHDLAGRAVAGRGRRSGVDRRHPSRTRRATAEGRCTRPTPNEAAQRARCRRGTCGSRTRRSSPSDAGVSDRVPPGRGRRPARR